MALGPFHTSVFPPEISAPSSGVAVVGTGGGVFCFVFFVPLFCACASFPRIPRCGRAPPTACTSRRGTRSTARSAAATFTRRVMGESERESRQTEERQHWVQMVFSSVALSSQVEEGVAEEKMHSEERISDHLTRHSQ